MVKMKALIQFPYFGRALAIGEPFEASESDARVFQLTGRAEVDGNRADAPAPAAQAGGQAYLTRDMAAAPVRGRGRSKAAH